MWYFVAESMGGSPIAGRPALGWLSGAAPGGVARARGARSAHGAPRIHKAGARALSRGAQRTSRDKVVTGGARQTNVLLVAGLTAHLEGLACKVTPPKSSP